MQWWTKAPGERAEALLRWMMRRGFPLLIWLAPRIPRWVLVAGAWLIINVVMVVYPAPKRAARINLGRVLGREPRDPVVGRATRRLVHSFGMAWADLFSLGQMSREALLELVVARDGVELLDRVHADGKGAILLTAHLGPWEVGAIIVRSLGMPISIVYVPDRFAEAEHFRSLLRRGAAGDVEEIPLDLDDHLSTLPALRALAAGRLLAMQGDRDFNGRGTPVSFFGRQVRFPVGPLLLARMTGAPVVPAFVLYRDDFTLAVEVGEAFEVAKTHDRAADVRAALGHWATILEDAVRRHPTQWFTFYDLFTQSAAEPPGAVASVPMRASEV
jgi:KDO2-lipid IV(A) lauroyltransferase